MTFDDCTGLEASVVLGSRTAVCFRFWTAVLLRSIVSGSDAFSGAGIWSFATDKVVFWSERGVPCSITGFRPLVVMVHWGSQRAISWVLVLGWEGFLVHVLSWVATVDLRLPILVMGLCFLPFGPAAPLSGSGPVPAEKLQDGSPSSSHVSARDSTLPCWGIVGVASVAALLFPNLRRPLKETETPGVPPDDCPLRLKVRPKLTAGIPSSIVYVTSPGSVRTVSWRGGPAGSKQISPQLLTVPTCFHDWLIRRYGNFSIRSSVKSGLVSFSAKASCKNAIRNLIRENGLQPNGKEQKVKLERRNGVNFRSRISSVTRNTN
ncbi:methionine aminopeptidase 2B [Striga asiatica]|uniref:Methionine aminopeptidase 2B n=1 Tax=Striga asiatica TaxID=4170 RepID=A0A5A7QKI2_STRAF|nr:methionine aminopeptidase 2B [Striga asiatica]